MNLIEKINKIISILEVKEPTKKERLDKYIKSVKNKKKKEYAEKWVKYRLGKSKKPDVPSGLGYMGAQAVRMSIDGIIGK